jgi:hypothetical protein
VCVHAVLRNLTFAYCKCDHVLKTVMFISCKMSEASKTVIEAFSSHKGYQVCLLYFLFLYFIGIN